MVMHTGGGATNKGTLLMLEYFSVHIFGISI